MPFDPISELSSSVYTATIKNTAGDPVPYTDLDTFTLTLYDTGTGEIINSRDDQNILNANQVTVDSDGLITWNMLPEDNVIVNDVGANETHAAEFYAIWNGGASALSHQVVFTVINLRKLTS